MSSTREDVIVVGVDGSKPSDAAVDWAAAHAARSGSRVHIVCAYRLPSFTSASLESGYQVVDDSAVEDGAKDVVKNAAERAAKLGVEVSTALETGDPVGVLVELSKHATLMVVGTRGGGGFADRLLGTVSSALPAHARCPVAVIPSRDEDNDFLPVKSIVVGVDGSQPARAALDYAIAESLVWDAPLSAVATVPAASGSTWLPMVGGRDEVLADVRAGLQVAVKQAVGDQEVKIRSHALEGNAAALLTEFSTAVDLVVVGSRGRGGFSGLLLGSTSQTVLHHAVCPVLVVPSRDRDEQLNPADVPWRRGKKSN